MAFPALTGRAAATRPKSEPEKTYERLSGERLVSRDTPRPLLVRRRAAEAAALPIKPRAIQHRAFASPINLAQDKNRFALIAHRGRGISLRFCQMRLATAVSCTYPPPRGAKK